MSKTRIFCRLKYWLLFVLFILVFSGCRSRSAQFQTYIQPELLYLNPEPYGRLYVEVDIIEGIEVPDHWINELKTFLSKYCSKPDGIEIVRDKPVPISAIKGLSIDLTSILYTDGPRPDSREQPAYLHVVFHKKMGRLGDDERTSRINTLCPCSIVCTEGKAKAFALKHEAGHILGLCKNTAHGDGVHCLNRRCLMYARRDLFWSLGSLVGSQTGQLCTDCRHDLELCKSDHVETNLVFKGPFLIRRQDAYSVASLPSCDLIIPIPVESVLDWKETLSHIKNKIRESQRAALKEDCESQQTLHYITGLYNPHNTNTCPGGTVDELAILKKATDDPSQIVKNYAIDKVKQFEQEEKQREKGKAMD